MYFEDPVLGHRQVPKLGREEQGKLPISDKSSFSISQANRKVLMTDSGLSVGIGDTLIYLLQ
jgi:hypothetical protein